EVENRSKGRNDLTITVVGQEPVDDKVGYWLETAVTEPGSGKVILVKHLIVREGEQTDVKRMIAQSAGSPPMEMPPSMAHPGGRRKPASPEARRGGERVGTEDITTPAGTFTTEHYRSKDGLQDVW